MDLLKKADKTFRVVLRRDDKLPGSSVTEPEFNIKNNYQEQYKFYNRCIMKVDCVAFARGADGLGSVVAIRDKVMTLSYNGSQSNSFDGLNNDQTSVVSIIITPTGPGASVPNAEVTNLACEITNIFGLVKFKFDQPIPVDCNYIIAYTLYFYKEQ